MPGTAACDGFVALIDVVEFELLPQPTSAAATDSAAVLFKCVNFMELLPLSGLRLDCPRRNADACNVVNAVVFSRNPLPPQFYFLRCFLLVR